MHQIGQVWIAIVKLFSFCQSRDEHDLNFKLLGSGKLEWFHSNCFRELHVKDFGYDFTYDLVEG